MINAVQDAQNELEEMRLRMHVGLRLQKSAGCLPRTNPF